jgi:Mrp family chromosome partitioning ATPase
MSQIDQAFIQAYAPEGALPAADDLPLSTAKAQAGGPRLRVHSQAPENQASWAPHFAVSGGNDPYAEIAALQQAALQTPPPAPTVGPPRERRPLSSFAAPPASLSQAFRPVFEVDAFRWPTITDELLQDHAGLLVPVAEQLLAASAEGRSLVGIAGIRPGVGATTVHLCLARLIASAGKAVAIVDGDFASRSLAHNLGLECDAGWETVLAGQASLAECVVRSVDNGIALLPLVGHPAPPVELLTSIQTSVSAGVLRYHYDVVLFDLGAACREPQASAARTLVEHCRIDANIIVADWSRDHTAGAEQVEQLMSLFGTTCLGLVGNQSLR